MSNIDTITRADLVSDLVASGLSRKDARTALDVIASSAANALSNGLRVKLPGLGTLEPRLHKGKEGVLGGHAYTSPARLRPGFKPSAGLLREMNRGE